MGKEGWRMLRRAPYTGAVWISVKLVFLAAILLAILVVGANVLVAVEEVVLVVEALSALLLLVSEEYEYRY